MYKAISSTKIFVLLYLILILPTYLADIGIAGPGTFLYGISMAGIYVICLIRGDIIAKHWLVLMPTVSFLFDLTPALAVISIAPYVYHCLAIIIGISCPPKTVARTPLPVE